MAPDGAASPRRVLHFIDTGGPGGAETIFLELLTGLDPQRWLPIAVVPERDWLHEALRRRGAETLLLTSEGSFDLRYLSRLAALARERRIDVIQTHLLATGVYASLAARLRRIPVVATFHGRADVAPGERYLRAKAGILGRRRNRIVFVSEALRRWFVKTLGLRAELTRVVHNGIDLDHFIPSRNDAIRRELGIGSEATLVGAIGNLRRPKRYDVFLRAAALLRDRHGGYRFVAVGQGEGRLREELLALRSALGLDEVFSFVGFRNDIREVLGGLDVYVLSSSFEGFSLTTLQAVACGVPVVATRCGGPEEIVEEGRSGTLVDPDSPEALAAAVHETVQRERRAGGGRIVHRRRGSVERFSLQAMVGRYETLYEECLSAGAPTAVGRGAYGKAGAG